MVHYKLSNAATNDIIGIYKYGLNQFGERQAKKYINELELFLNQVISNQNLTRDASMFARNLKYNIFKKHVIFYHVDDKNSIFVIRILGSRMNFIEHI